MKQSERGFTLLELLIVTAIIALLASSATASIFQVLHGSQRTENQMTAVSQVENAGYWISLDAQKAQTVNATELEAEERTFIVSWDQNTSGGIDPGDGLYFAFSHDGGSTWSSDIEAFHGYPDSSFGYTIPDGYLTDQFRMRYYLDYFGGADEYLYLDNIAIYEEIFSDDCSNFDNWDNGANWDVFSEEFRGRGGIVGGGAEGWYDNKWQYRKKITIDHNKVEADLTDFPVLISITDSDLRDYAKSDGSDIVFTSSNGVTTLKREIESYDNSDGTLVAWVKTDLSSISDTEIYIYYGNLAASETNDADTWDSNFKMVQHLKDETTSSTADSTSNDNDGVKLAAGAPIEADGKISKAQDFDGSDDKITIPNSSSLDVGSTFTAEAWVKWESGAEPAVEARILDRKTSQGDNNGWTIKVDDYDDDEVEVRGSGSKEASFENIVASWSAGDWYHIVIVFDGNTVYSYSDGVPFSSGTVNSTVNNNNDLLIGEYGGGGKNWNGKIDEVRLSDIERSDGWIKTSYNNQNTPGNFHSVGTEESIAADTETYYFDGFDSGEAWNNPDNMVDGDTGTNAWTEEAITPPNWYDTGWQYRKKITIDHNQVEEETEGWYDNEWQYRKKITIDHNQVEADLTDFPVLISITDSDLRDEAKSDGSDIVFTASDATTKLKREIESYDNSDGTLVVWVKTDLSSTSDTEIYIYYGNSAASETDDTDTWDANFKGVWHLSETPSDGSAMPIVQEDLETATGTGSTLNVPNVLVQNNNRVLYVFVTMNNEYYETTTSVKWKSGGSEQDFGSAIATVTNVDDAQVEVFRLIAPTTGTDTVYCTFSAAVAKGVAVAVVSLSEVDQTTPNGTVATDFGDTAEPALTVSSGGGTEVVYAACAAEYGTLTSDEPATEIWNLSPSGHMSAGNKKTGASPNVSFGWATGSSSSHWAVAGFSVKPASTAEPIKDSTLNNNDGTAQNMESGDQVDGQVDGSLDFDGSNEYVSIPTSSSLDITTDEITIDAWVKLEAGFDSSATQDQTLIDGGGKIEYWWEDSDGKLHFSLNTGGWQGLVSTKSSWSAGVWYHLVGVYNGTNRFLYIDGVEDNSQADSGNLAASSFGIHISNPSAGTNEGPFNGIIDEVRISDTARSAAWVETSYNNQNAPSSFYNVGTEESTPAVTTDLTDFTVLISITDSDLRDHAKSDGSDIVFTSSIGTVKLEREIESYDNSDGTLVAWVKTDLSSISDTEIYIYYGNLAASETNDTDTWDTSFKMVQHLDETSGTHQDSTSNNNDGTPGGGVIQDATGKIDGADEFAPSNDYVDTGDAGLSASAGTLELWGKADTFGSRYLFGHIGNLGSYNNRIQLYTDDTAGNLDLGLGDQHERHLNIQDLDVDTWYYIALTWDGSNYEVFVDAISKATGGYTGLSTIGYSTIGNTGNPDSYDEAFDGILDEVRVSSIVRTDAWIKTSYNNQSAPANFYSLATEEAITGNTQLLNSNTCPGTDLGIINKVELRIYAAAYQGEENDDIILRPVFGAGDGGDHQLDVPSDSSPGPDWSSWTNITNDTNAPFPWTWADVQNLDCDVVHKLVGSLECVLGFKVEIRVTYQAPLPEAERYLTMSTELDLSFYQGETVTVFWDHREDGILESDDYFYFAVSRDGGNTWSSNIQAFSDDIGDTPQPFSYTIPQQYLIAGFKIRFFVDFDSSGESVYVDNILISLLKFSDDCSSFANWNNGADWDVSVGEFRGHHYGGSESERYLTMSTNLALDPGLATAAFPLTFTWTSWSDFSDTGTKHEVTYSIVGGRLMRSHSVDDGDPVETFIAHYIDSTNTVCQLAGNKLTFTIRAVVGSDPVARSETREFRIFSRPD